MRYLLLPITFSVAFLLLPALSSSAERSDIAGVWRLDTANEPTLEGRMVISGRLTVEYSHKMIEMSESMTFPDGDRSEEKNWKVDSHYHPVLGDGSGQVLARWDGLALTADHENAGAHETIRLALSPDGRHLTETIQRADGSTRVLHWNRI
jgi:hypothetical protein